MTNRRKAERYIEAVSFPAREAMLKTGVPASFLIADFAVLSHFGSRRVTRPNSFESIAGTEDRWSVILDTARAIVNYYPEISKQRLTPVAFVRSLAARGYFGRKPHLLKAVLAVMKTFRAKLQQIEGISKAAVAAFKKVYMRQVWLLKIAASTEKLIERAAEAGVSRRDALAFLAAS